MQSNGEPYNELMHSIVSVGLYQHA